MTPLLHKFKQYSSYNSSTRECRTGGVREWFHQNSIKSGDEVVIQLIDKEHFIYRLIPERNFLEKTKELQVQLDDSKTERDAIEKISSLTQWTQSDTSKVIMSEFYRLSAIPQSENRLYSKRNAVRAKEDVPPHLRTLLGDVYKGHCQVCDFWFLKKNKKPYFEIHHLDPMKGHHPKNLVVVCGNCHNQLEYAEVTHEFDRDSWLVKVIFSKNVYLVRQALVSKKMEFIKKALIS